jgi:hypothetical protein
MEEEQTPFIHLEVPPPPMDCFYEGKEGNDAFRKVLLRTAKRCGVKLARQDGGGVDLPPEVYTFVEMVLRQGCNAYYEKGVSTGIEAILEDLLRRKLLRELENANGTTH